MFGALGLVSFGLLRQRNETAALRRDLDDRARKLEARQDRLQRMVTDRGWKDSFDLTRINWERPGQF